MSHWMCSLVRGEIVIEEVEKIWSSPKGRNTEWRGLRSGEVYHRHNGWEPATFPGQAVWEFQGHTAVVRDKDWLYWVKKAERALIAMEDTQ